MRTIKRVLLWSGMVLVTAVLLILSLLAWPEPFFPYTLAMGKIVVASDRPIPVVGGKRFISDCEGLLERSPLKPEDRRYHIYVTNVAWHHSLFFAPVPIALGLTYIYGVGADSFLSGADFSAGQLVHWNYVAPPPRTLAYFCAHELTHSVTAEHVGLVRFLQMPGWVREGLADYVGIENRQSFAQLRDALGDRPEDNLMRQTYGSYPRYRLLVTYFLEERKWSSEQLLKTNLTEAEAIAIMRKAR